MHENPSAGKFDPPPPPRDPLVRKPVYQRWWFAALILVTGYPLSHWLLFVRDRDDDSLSGLWAPIAGLAAMAVHYALRRYRSDARSGGDDDSPA
jgi:hypothetical protein